MTDRDPSARLTREERLAAKLRENLRRRKAQARALDPQAPEQGHTDPDQDAALPKPAPSR